MPEITIDLPPEILARLREIAAEKSATVEDVVRHFLDCSIGMYETALTTDEIKAQVESFGPKLPRPVIDRAKIQGMVDKYKPATPGSGEPTA